MALGEAKAKCKREFAALLEVLPYSIEEVRAYATLHPECNRGLYHVPHYDGIVSTAARLAKHLCERMAAEGIVRGTLAQPESELAAE